MSRVNVITFERTGELVCHGDDLHRRPDAIEFRARTDQREIDRLAEVVVTVDRWGGDRWVAQLLISTGAVVCGAWSVVAEAIPLDKSQAYYILSETAVRLVFGEYVRLQPGGRYRLYLPNAVLTKPTITVKGIQKFGEPIRARVRTRTRRRA